MFLKYFSNSMFEILRIYFSENELINHLDRSKWWNIVSWESSLRSINMTHYVTKNNFIFNFYNDI